MATSYRQDAPPKGGFGEIQWQKVMPKRGYSGIVTFAAVFLYSGINLTIAVQQKGRRNQHFWMQRDSRKGISALLEAEKDRDLLRRMKHNEEAEALIMASVPGWVAGASPMHADRFHPPTDVRDYAVYTPNPSAGRRLWYDMAHKDEFKKIGFI